MMKQNREQSGRDHEQPELGCLAQIFGPMLAERSDHNRSPPAIRLSLPKGEGFTHLAIAPRKSPHLNPLPFAKGRGGRVRTCRRGVTHGLTPSMFNFIR